jgi:hypothetical protein
MSVYPVLKPLHSVRYYMIQTQVSDEPLGILYSIGSSSVEANLLVHLCLI